MIHIKHKKNRDIGHASTAFYVFHHIDDPLWTLSGGKVVLKKLGEFVSNKAKGRISKRVLQENKARQIFRKTNISYPLIRTRTPFCLITDEFKGVKRGLNRSQEGEERSQMMFQAMCE